MEQWQRPETIGYWILSSLIIVVLLASFIVLLVRVTFRKIIDAKNKEFETQLQHRTLLLETSLLVQEKERTRIAADIHDDLIGKLFRVQFAISTMSSENEILISECISTARRISHDLLPPLIETSNTFEIISGIVSPFRSELKIDISVVGKFYEDVLQEAKIQVVRVVQEALTNSIKHASATEIGVVLRFGENGFSLVMRDNGCGFETQRESLGLGIRNIETRIYHLKGCVKLKSKEDKGTTLIFFIPNKIVNHE